MSDSPLDTLLLAARLKLVPRIGWRLRGVAQPESVADHTFGVAFTALVLADLSDEPLDIGRLLRIALVHDLAESLVTDIPATMSRFLAPEAKHAAERAALAEIVAPLPDAGHYLALWEEYDAGSSAEALLVRDADKLELMLQAYLYEQRGHRNLDDFWQGRAAESFRTPAAADLFRRLRQRRAALFPPPTG